MKALKSLWGYVPPLWVVVLIIIIVLLLKWYGSSSYTVWSKLGVPHPTPMPFFGHALQMSNPRYGSRGVLRGWLKHYGRVFGIYFFREPMLVVADPNLLNLIFVKDFDKFSDRFFLDRRALLQPIMKKNIFFGQGCVWRRIRNIVGPTFSQSKIKTLMHHINRSASRLGDKVSHSAIIGEKMEAKDLFGAFTLDVIFSTAFGLDINSQYNTDSSFVVHAKSLTTPGKPSTLAMFLIGLFPFLGSVFKYLGMTFYRDKDVDFFKSKLSQLIAERKKELGCESTKMDLLQHLLNAEIEEVGNHHNLGSRKLSLEEIIAHGITYVIAGYDTMSTTLQFLIYELSHRKNIQEKVMKEIDNIIGSKSILSYEDISSLKYMDAVIHESLRMYPPVHMLRRKVHESVTLNKNITIPANSGILIPVGNISNDPEFFPDPEKFIPERFFHQHGQQFLNSVTFLPFGFGPRQCPGMKLSLLEIKVALVYMLRKVEFLKAEPEILQYEDFSGTLVPKKPIVLKFTAR